MELHRSRMRVVPAASADTAEILDRRRLGAYTANLGIAGLTTFAAVVL